MSSWMSQPSCSNPGTENKFQLNLNAREACLQNKCKYWTTISQTRVIPTNVTQQCITGYGICSFPTFSFIAFELVLFSPNLESCNCNILVFYCLIHKGKCLCVCSSVLNRNPNHWTDLDEIWHRGGP